LAHGTGERTEFHLKAVALLLPHHIWEEAMDTIYCRTDSELNVHIACEPGSRQEPRDGSNHLETAEDLMAFASEGHVPKSVLTDLLAPEIRQDFLDSCAAIEMKFTEDCAATGDFCLESGCALEGEACLNALLNAGPAYHKACAAVWRDIFHDPRNRAAWRAVSY